MKHKIPLAKCLAAAFAAGNSPAIIAVVLVVHHRPRLKRLFWAFAVRFLEAYGDMRAHPANRTAGKRTERAKALLDLVRCRMAALGQRSPADAEILEWARESDLPRLVHRRAA
jgi:hypothetical protein